MGGMNSSLAAGASYNLERFKAMLPSKKVLSFLSVLIQVFLAYLHLFLQVFGLASVIVSAKEIHHQLQ